MNGNVNKHLGQQGLVFSALEKFELCLCLSRTAKLVDWPLKVTLLT